MKMLTRKQCFMDDFIRLFRHLEGYDTIMSGQPFTYNNRQKNLTENYCDTPELFKGLNQTD